MIESCLFCKIIGGDVEAEFVAETENLVAFRDIQPQAPVHVLLCSRRHIPSAHDLAPEDGVLLNDCFSVAREIATREGVEDGYRIATNVGSLGGQAIAHLHFHLLGGRKLGRIDSESWRAY